ncbi:GumC family protein [Devosia oryziradicis]|uniref:GumC family protein n=1 Tax=Devosia oryziradicis TaxID=2801335 RepID=A0ABX7BTN6_9HYPH|nr:GumC family protein [Devosia oryziradicis]QQR35318.1 GumC family protein [Devosia oryziradicis]
MARDARIDIGAVLGAVVKRLPRVVIVTAALLAAALVLTMFMPRLYESSASILVEPRSNIYTRPAGEQPQSAPSADAGVVSSQIELIKSRDTLLTVVDKLDLRSVPEFNGTGAGGFSPLAVVSQLLGRKATPVSVDEVVLGALYDRMTVIQERDSRLISVLVRSTDPQLAADIANAVADAHVARRAQLSLSDTAEASGWLANEIAKLRVSVTEAETAVANFKVDNDLFVGSNNTSLADQQLSTIATQINAAQERKNAALSRAALIRRMIEQGQPIDGVADVRDSVVIQQLSQEKGRLQGEKAQRSATLLANHPTIQALTAQIAELNNQINLEGRRVADALEAEAQIEADLEASLRADLTRAKSSASTATQDGVTLDSLERDAKAQRDLLESYLQRHTEAVSRIESNSALPDVRVVSVAAPSVTPASPKTPLILLAVGLVALATQIGVIVFGELVSGRAIVATSEAVHNQDQLDEVPFIEAELEPEQQWSEPVIATEEVVEERVLDLPADVEDYAEVDEPAVELPTPAVSARSERRPPAASVELPGIIASADLSSDLVLGRTHLLILAAHAANADCEILAEKLVSDALARGLSVALIDGGSARLGDEPGLTDLSLDAASFGDVVQKSADNSFAEVPWGQGRAIDRTSGKPLILVEALGDIYEVVVLMTGRVGAGSTLPLFDGLDGRLVLVAGDDDDIDAVSQTREKLLSAGYRRCEVVAAPTRVAA